MNRSIKKIFNILPNLKDYKKIVSLDFKDNFLIEKMLLDLMENKVEVVQEDNFNVEDLDKMYGFNLEEVVNLNNTKTLINYTVEEEDLVINNMAIFIYIKHLINLFELTIDTRGISVINDTKLNKDEKEEIYTLLIEELSMFYDNLIYQDLSFKTIKRLLDKHPKSKMEVEKVKIIVREHLDNSYPIKINLDSFAIFNTRNYISTDFAFLLELMKDSINQELFDKIVKEKLIDDIRTTNDKNDVFEWFFTSYKIDNFKPINPSSLEVFYKNNIYAEPDTNLVKRILTFKKEELKNFYLNLNKPIEVIRFLGFMQDILNLQLLPLDSYIEIHNKVSDFVNLDDIKKRNYILARPHNFILSNDTFTRLILKLLSNSNLNKLVKNELIEEEKETLTIGYNKENRLIFKLDKEEVDKTKILHNFYLKDEGTIDKMLRRYILVDESLYNSLMYFRNKDIAKAVTPFFNVEEKELLEGLNEGFELPEVIFDSIVAMDKANIKDLVKLEELETNKIEKAFHFKDDELNDKPNYLNLDFAVLFILLLNYNLKYIDILEEVPKELIDLIQSFNANVSCFS